MSDRYSKLFALPENLYSVGAPVVIAAGALQKDNQTGKVFAQLKIRNIQDKIIKAVTVKITPFDTAGKPLGGTVDYQYLDLSAGRDTDFGQKTPVVLKEAATRSFAVSVLEVIFSDNSIWTASNAGWEPLSVPVVPEKEFTDGELAKQYRVKYGADCKCVFKMEKDLWRCACGAINHDSEKNCHSCQREAVTLAALNVDNLKIECDERIAVEQKKAKKNKKIAIIAALIVVIAIVAAVLISNFVKAQQEEAARLEAYNAAVALVEAGQYDEAIAAFTELGDYKDSADQILNTRYTEALSLAGQGDYDKAIATFTELGDYKDSADQIKESTYQKAVALLQTGKYEEAISILTELGDYKDSANQIENAINLEKEADYQAAIELLNTEPGTEEYYNAVAESRRRLMSLNGYRDSDELLQNFYSDIISENGLYYLYDDEGKVIYDGYTYSYHENGTVDTFSLTNYAVTFKVVSYDGEGRMLRAEKDNQGSEYYTYTYDENGRLIRRYNGGIDNPVEITYIYDDNGRLIRMKSTYYMQYGSTSENTYPYRYVDMTGTILSDGGAAVSGGRYIRQIGWIYAPNAKR